MKTNRKPVLRYAAAALGLGALAVLGATSFSAAPAANTTVQARAHPAGGTFIPPQVPQMRLGQTEGEPTTTTVPQSVRR